MFEVREKIEFDQRCGINMVDYNTKFKPQRVCLETDSRLNFNCYQFRHLVRLHSLIAIGEPES